MGRVDILADKLMESYDLSEDQAYAVADYVISDEKVHFASSGQLGLRCVRAALRRAREDMGWTQVQAGIYLGVGQPSVYLCETRGTGERRDTLERMVRGYRFEGDLHNGLMILVGRG